MKPVPCQHIADYYEMRWWQSPSIGLNLLRQGYRDWACGGPTIPFNNLYLFDSPK